MTEAEFLECYDISKFPRPSVTVDIVMMSVINTRLAVLLNARHEHPFKGKHALLGGFVGIDESVDAAAQRVLREKMGISDVFMEQLYTFGDVQRDPRGRVITIVHLALVQPDVLLKAVVSAPSVDLGYVDVKRQATISTAKNKPIELAFDHGNIVALAIERIQGKLGYLPISLNFFSQQFTLRDLQSAHEAVLGMDLNKPAFRRKMLDTGWIEGTGELEAGTSFRPAELYRRVAV
jgi:8-oxo-dGTP diphosphatase